MHLVLEPDLPVALRLVVGEQYEGRLRARGDVRFEQGQEPSELAAVVEPQAHAGALLVLEALFELADQCFEDHPATPETRRTPARSSGAMLTFTPSSRSGTNPWGASRAPSTA
jgi:hypothetical protein